MAAVKEGILGQAIASFFRDGLFPPDNEVSAMHVQSSALPVALNVLASAKVDLESEIRNISSQSAPEVDSWIKHAKALREDIDSARILAADISRQAEAGDTLYHVNRDAEDRVEFLSKELKYSQQVSESLQIIKNVRDILDKAEQAAVEREILVALHLLSKAWDFIYAIPTDGRTRAIRLLDERAFTLRASIHENFNAVWKALLIIDIDTGSITIQTDTKEIDIMDMNSAVITMKAYEELNDRVQQFSTELENLIIKPRLDLKVGTLPSIDIQNNTLRVSTAHADRTIKSLLADLEQIIVFLNSHLPPEFISPLSNMMMPKLCSQVKEIWLDSAVPASLEDMTAFRKAMALVQVFADNLKALKWTGAEEFHDWVENAPRIWLTKRRERSLDWTRNQLSLGIGNPRKVDRVETHKISRNEGKHIASNGSRNRNDWDAAWSDEEQDGNSPERTEIMITGQNSHSKQEPPQAEDVSEDDDGADAWGWGDDEVGEGNGNYGESEIAQQESKPFGTASDSESLREVTLTEKYTISSMPDPVLRTISLIIEDGATLTQTINEQNPVAAAAAGLFALPTLVLAMYRAVSPYYYTLSSGGNMYLYNDAMWLAEQLRDFAVRWAAREDLSPRARGKVKLEGEIEVLEKFGRRAYGQEMSTQRTILSDLLGGTQNFLQQDGQSADDDEISVESVVSHIRNLSTEWRHILSKSACAQATGSLLSTVAKKMILDVQDLTSLGADEAYRVANLISKIVTLDDLFLPEDQTQPPIPVTSQYAPDWLKLHYLSELLQSDLTDVKYLWFESELSLYFTAEEVVDLVELSFENSHRTREAIASFKDNPKPRGVNTEDL